MAIKSANVLIGHKRPCKHCSQGYRILAILDKRAKAKGLAARGLLEKQQIEEMQHEIVLAKEDLDEYRSHISRLKTEAEFDQKELEELADDTAKVISDWKMKLLACYFRENQANFFGKRGVSLLGFMIISNLRDEESRAAGLKDVRFVMMITDDTLQDEWSVMCAKHEIYSNHLPEFISKVKFQSDGAGCFSSMLNRIVQPLWGAWTGIEEVECRISPRGGGKSQLDGMFAKCESCCLFECLSISSDVLTACHFFVVGQVMSSSVDSGASYWDSSSSKETFEQSGGLTATVVHTFAPYRTSRIWGKLGKYASLESVLRTTLNPRDLSLTARKHSEYGAEVHIKQSDMFIFPDQVDHTRAIPKTKRLTGAAVVTRDLGA
jgi:hypothetical protein